MSRADREHIASIFERGLPLLARKAGAPIIAELVDTLHEIRERRGGDLQLVEKAVGLLTEFDRQHKENAEDWLRLRRDATTAPTPQIGKARILIWWSEQNPSVKCRKTRRLAAKNPPELDACREIHLANQHKLELQMEYLLSMLSSVNALGGLDPQVAAGYLDTAWSIATRPLRWSLRATAFDALYKGYRFGLRSGSLVPRVLQQIAADESEHPWVRRGALQGLALLDSKNAWRLARNVFEHINYSRDAFLFRRAILSVIQRWGPEGSELVRKIAQRDPSPAVRQKAVLHVLAIETTLDEAFISSASRDPEGIVRGAWTLTLGDDLDVQTLINVLKLAASQLACEKDDGLLGICLRALTQHVVSLPKEMFPPLVCAAFAEFAKEMIEAGKSRDLPMSAHPWWHLAVELALVLGDEAGRGLFFALRGRIEKTPQTGSFRIKTADLPENADITTRVFTALAAWDFGFYVRRGRRTWRVHRGQIREMRLWRIWYELTHWSYDKRQGHSHVVGWSNRGDLWFPSLVMGEVTRTRVPGERVFVPAFGSWAPQVPGPTDAVNVRSRREITIVVPGYEARLSPGRGCGPRWVCDARTTYGFARLDNARFNALRLGTDDALRDYMQRFSQSTGIHVRVRSEGGYWNDKLGVEHLAIVLGPLDALGRFLTNNENLSFFLTPFTNEMKDLALFLVAMGLFLFGKQIVRRVQIRRARSSIPLSVGGWGSRGKSGSERAKAALFHGLGYRIFSKTTGTVPMFISSQPGIDPVEIPIYRPYDKATIWEQVDMLRQAALLDTQVFLWECMALNPRYVSIITHDWMRDDFATVTNTYPDHEDIQGPTGDDVARTIALFIPHGAHCVSTETQMTPILAEQAYANGTDLAAVPEAVSALLPPEFLERFPYLEHPLNVAMVVTLGQKLGVDPDVALTVIADHIVADVGSLRQSPTVEIQGRWLDFTNIMSANERAGFWSSFERLGLSTWKEERRITDRTILVVNNREDRPARSHVFAKVIVEDTPVDGVVVVGSAVIEFNKLLLHYFEAFAERHARPVSDDPQGLQRWLDTLFHPVRRRPKEACRWPASFSAWLGPDPEVIETAFGATFSSIYEAVRAHRGSLGDDFIAKLQKKHEKEAADAVTSLYDRGLTVKRDGALSSQVCTELVVCAALHVFSQMADHEGSRLIERRKQLLDFLGHLMRARTVVVTDPGVPAETVMKRCIELTPLGTTAHLVGTQNIKGPGLRFVKLWSNLETLFNRTRALLEGSEHDRAQALEWLLQLRRLTAYEAMVARQALWAKAEDGVRTLTLEEKTLADKLTDVINEFASRPDHAAVQKVTLRQRLYSAIDQVIDFRDAISRRKQAGRVMELLACGLISHPEAAARLEQIYERQKKGRLSARG